MAARIVLWVFTLGILAVFHLSVTIADYCNMHKCRNKDGCYFCMYLKPEGNCLNTRLCFKPGGIDLKCAKYDYKEEKRICGTPPPQNIVNCSQANEGNWPWLVSLQDKHYHHVCWGVLIARQWVLISGHCLYKKNVNDWIVVLGEFDVKRISGNGQYNWIKHIIVHPEAQLQHSISKNDVALIRLKNDVYYDEYVSPICLPSLNDVFSNDSCSIIGWGETKGKADILRVRKVTPMDKDQCGIRRVWTDRICVHYGSPFTSCIGDIGGPLFCARSSDGRLVVAGVKSYMALFEPGYINVYTKTATFLTWIDEILYWSVPEKP